MVSYGPNHLTTQTFANWCLVGNKVKIPWPNVIFGITKSMSPNDERERINNQALEDAVQEAEGGNWELALDIIGLNTVAGELEMLKTARSCLDSKDNISFVVGPTRSGKSTQLPYFIAKKAGRPVICVQPDGNVARRHAEYLTEDKMTSVGICDDSEEIPPGFKLKDDITYMSYKWVYRLVMAAQNQEWRDSYEEAKREEMVCAIVLDEVHASTVSQELGYLAVKEALRGVLQFPPGWSHDMKVILTTAYPLADPFKGRFQLSKEQIDRQTLSISVDKEQVPVSHIEAVFIDDNNNGWQRSDRSYHHIAKNIVESILDQNPEANVLVMTFGDACAGSEIISQMTPVSGARVFDLSVCKVQAVNSRGSGGSVIVATPDYASRVPVEGITDVVCPYARVVYTYDELLCKNVLTNAVLNRWEVYFVKNHLDPKCKHGRIHCVFPRSAKREIRQQECSYPRFMRGDCIEYWLGVARLIGVDGAQGPENQHRYIPQSPAFVRARQQLFEGLGLLKEHSGTTSLAEDNRAQITFSLMDRAGLDCRAAVFLGDLAANVQKSSLSSENKDIVLLVGALLTIFDRDPVLRKRSEKDPYRVEDLKLGDSLRLVNGVMSEAWINAGFWMTNLLKFYSEGFTLHRPTSKKNWIVDYKMFAGAKDKLERLAKQLEVGARSLWMIEVTSYILRRTREWKNIGEGPILMFETSPFLSYVKAYRYNLMWFEAASVLEKPDEVYGKDISTMQNVLLDLRYTAIDPIDEAKRAQSERVDGFYACASRYVYKDGKVMAQNITVIPPEMLQMLLPLNKNLRTLLRLR